MQKPPFEPIAPITDLYYVAPDPVNNIVPEEQTLSTLMQQKNRLDGVVLTGIPLYFSLERPFKPGRFNDRAACLYIKDKAGKVLMMDGYGCVRKGNKEYFMHPWEFASIYERFGTMFVNTSKEVARASNNNGLPGNSPRVVNLQYIGFRQGWYSGKGESPYSQAKIMLPENRLNVSRLPETMLRLLPMYFKDEFVPAKYNTKENRLFVKLSNGVSYLVDGMGHLRTRGRDYFMTPRNYLATRLWCYEAYTKTH